MTYLKKTQERILKDGTNYFLFHMDGTRYHITERTIASNKVFKMDGFLDPHDNSYSFTYDESDLLTEVAGPNTNHYFRFEYQRLTNAVDPGIIRFSYASTNAIDEVQLAGTFNGWQGSENPMAFSNGEWVADVELAKGFYAYKFIVRYSGDPTYYWVTDPDNPISGGMDSNSVAIIDPFRIISRVEGGDGRSVEYRYDWAYNGHPDRIIDILLVEATYDDGSVANYSYYSGEETVENRALFKTADDPLVQGAGRAVSYTYQTNTIYGGMVHEEFSLISSQLLGRLEFDPGNVNVRIYTDARGEVTRYGYITNTCNLSTQTNAVGYVNQYEYFADGEGMLWKEIDPLGRTTVYTRTWNFGAVLTISNATGNCGCEADVVNVYTDENYPFYLASQSKKGGLTTTWTRDAHHRPIRIDYPDGSFETNAYNDFGQLIAQRKPDGALWTWGYDARGRKITETDPLNNTTRFGYDAYDRLTLVSNALGHVARYFYNWRGQVTNVVYADNTEEKTWYSFYGDVTQRLDRAGGVSVRRFDALGHLAEEVNSVDATNRFIHDPMGRLEAMTTPLGLTVSNTYDAIGRKIRETFSSDNTYNEWHYDPDGIRTQINRLGFATRYTYNHDQHLELTVDSLGRVTSNAYDVAGRLVTSVNPEGGVFTYSYDAMSRILTRTDCSGALWSNTYDGVGRLLSVIDPNGIETVNVYDPIGRLVSTHVDGLLVASNRYDEIGRVVWRQDAEGLVITNTYDAAGRLLTIHMPDSSFSQNIYSNTYLHQTFDRAGRATTYERDVMGRVLAQIDNGSNAVHYAYDVSGNMTNLTDQSGSQTAWSYDIENRQVKKTYHDGKAIDYTYDAGSRLISKFDAGVRLTLYNYDPVGNMTNIVYPNDPQVLFRYDVMNRMTEMVDGVGTTSYEYVCGKLVNSTDPFGHTVAYDYDEGSRLTNAFYAGYDVHYAYDGLGRISAVSGPGGLAAYQYAANGRRVDVLEHGNGMETHYGYDALMRLTNMTHATSGSEVRASYAYTYNDADLRTSMTVGDATPSSRNIDYDYDPIGQLTGADGDFPGYRYEYTYDPSGNPIIQDKNGLVSSNIFNELNQNVTSRWGGVGTVWGVANLTNGVIEVNGVGADLVDGVTFVATNLPLNQGTNIFSAVLTDPFGRADTNQITVEVADRGYGYDVFGNLTNDGRLVYAWDDADRLVEVRTATGELLLKNRYDGLSRRMEKVMPGETNRYLYSSPRMGSGWLVLAVADGNDEVIEVYTHGPDLAGTLGGAGGIGGILSVQIEKTLESYTYHYDANGNVVRLIDDNQVAVAHYEYSPFGEVLVADGSVTARYQFSTKEIEGATTLNYYGYRFYSPKLGSWINRDVIGEIGSVNLYSFCGNDIVNAIDFLGLTPCPSGYGPITTGPDGKPVPVGLPPGDWSWAEDKGNSRGGTWIDRSTTPHRNASWEEGGSHWDLNDGRGNRTRWNQDGKFLTPEEAHKQCKPIGDPKPTPQNCNPSKCTQSGGSKGGGGGFKGGGKGMLPGGGELGRLPVLPRGCSPGDLGGGRGGGGGRFTGPIKDPGLKQ